MPGPAGQKRASMFHPLARFSIASRLHCSNRRRSNTRAQAVHEPLGLTRCATHSSPSVNPSPVTAHDACTCSQCKSGKDAHMPLQIVGRTSGGEFAWTAKRPGCHKAQQHPAVTYVRGFWQLSYTADRVLTCTCQSTPMARRPSASVSSATLIASRRSCRPQADSSMVCWPQHNLVARQRQAAS